MICFVFQVFKLQLEEEKEKSRVLEEALHALATEHHELERSITSNQYRSCFYDTDDDEFYDCDNDNQSIGELSKVHLYCFCFHFIDIHFTNYPMNIFRINNQCVNQH